LNHPPDIHISAGVYAEQAARDMRSVLR